MSDALSPLTKAPRAICVTGASGFVGGRLLERFGAGQLPQLAGTRIHAISRSQPRGWPAPGVDFHACDLTDDEAVHRTVLGLDPAPEWVLHLAGQADPRQAARHPRQARSANAEATRNLLVALADRGLPTRFLLSSTAAVYGQHALDGEGRIPAGTRPRTRTAYGWSKRLAERVSLACRAENLEVLIARPYNHAGPGQGPGYVVPDLIEQLTRALREGGTMRTGNLWPERDILHVDDVLDGYLLLLQRGVHREVYDVAAGSTVAVQAIFDGLVARIGAPVGHEVDPALARGGEAPRIVGDARRLRALGWSPERDLDDILDDILARRGN